MPPNNFFVHPSAVIDEGAIIGEGTYIWHFCHVLSGAIIGKNCSLGQNVMVAGAAVLGNGVKVQNNVSVYSGVICEDEVFLGPSCVFTNVKNPRAAINRRGNYAPTFVKKGATIGANATILCGITIGRYGFIAAGAVVLRNVPDFALMAGNPAKQLGWMSAAGERLHFNESGLATCPFSGESYQLTNGIVSILDPTNFL